jgi:hypothetical protein
MADGQKIAEIIIRDAMNPRELALDRLNGMRIAAAQSFFSAGSSSHQSSSATAVRVDSRKRISNAAPFST